MRWSWIIIYRNCSCCTNYAELVYVKMKQCDGWRRYGGVMTLGSVKWVQCTHEAIATIKIIQDNEETIMNTCQHCLDEAKELNMKIVEVIEYEM